MKRIWLVRHAESAAQTGEHMGIDSPLSRLGILQAEQLKTPMAEIIFDKTFISPLKRARQTYEHSGLHCDKVVFDSRLVEEMPQNSYSSILPYEDLPAYGTPDTQNAWNLDPAQRAKSFIEEFQSSDDEKILVITHSGFMSILFQTLIRGHKTDHDLYLGMNNCGISSITLPSDGDPRTTVLFWNDISHVRQLLGYNPMK